MEQLPAEILNEIILKLHQQDKVECMQVCRRWEQVIKSSSLFNTVRVTTVDNMNQIINRLKNEPLQAARVERLILDIDDEFDTLPFSSIFPLLPNLRQFFMVNCGTIVESERNIYPFHRTIENIAEFTGVNLIQPLLHSNVCPSLTSISFSGNQRDIFPLLKKAPNLTRIALHNSFAFLRDIEVIHENAPELRSIYVEDMLLEEIPINRDVKPSNLVTECSLSPALETEAILNVHILEYISKKYPNLTRFAYSLNDESGKENHEFLDSFLQKLKPQLKSLTLSGYDGDGNRHCFLEDPGWQIHHMKFIFKAPSKLFMKKLMASVNSQYIQSLELVNVKCKMLPGLEKLTSLKKLELGFGIKKFKCNDVGDEDEAIGLRKVKFRDILKCFPASLENLSLKLAHIVTGEDDYGPQCSIKELSLKDVLMSKDVDHFISKQFPFLSTFRLLHVKGKKRDFVLPYASLSCFQFKGCESEDAPSVLVLENSKGKETIISSAKNYFSHQIYPIELSLYDAPVHRPIKSRPSESSSDNAKFSLICKSVRNIVWDDDSFRDFVTKFEG